MDLSSITLGQTPIGTNPITPSDNLTSITPDIHNIHTSIQLVPPSGQDLFPESTTTGIAAESLTDIEEDDDANIDYVNAETLNSPVNIDGEEDIPMSQIAYVGFTLWDYDLLKKEAVVKVTKADDHGPDTINDPRLGIYEFNKVCETCHKKIIDCKGHLGMIEFPKGLLLPHLFFMRHIVAVLNCVCPSCGSLLMSREMMEAKGILESTGLDNRLFTLEDASIGMQCRFQNNPPSHVNLECITGEPSDLVKNIASTPVLQCEKAYIYNTKDTRNATVIKYRKPDDPNKKAFPHEMDPKRILQIFCSITREDLTLMGFSPQQHPKNFILRAIPVISPKSRSPYMPDALHSQDNGVNSIYRTIITLVNKYTPQVMQDKQKEKELRNKLVKAIKSLFDNSDGAFTRGGKKPKTFKNKIGEKEGVIRKWLMGKRVRNSGRSVIINDPSLKFGEIGFPEYFASIFTTKETITSDNIAEMNKLLEEGKITHVTPSFGEHVNERIYIHPNIRKKPILQEGDVVDRHLQNGDIIIANRCPTLHKYSIMGFNIRLIKGTENLALRINMQYTTPYNADFDGDEMNFYVPQSANAKRDVMERLHVKQCIIDEQSNKPAMAEVYDELLAAYYLTYKRKYIPVRQFYNYLTVMTEPSQLKTLDQRLDKYGLGKTYFADDRILTADEVHKFFQNDRKQLTTDAVKNLGFDPTTVEVKYPGEALFSALLPENFYYHKSSKNGEVYIKDGVLITGILDKEHIGTAPNSIVQEIHQGYGADRTAVFLTDAPKVLNAWLTQEGFSISICDCDIGEKSKELIKQTISKAQLQVEQMMQGYEMANAIEQKRIEKQINAVVDVSKNLGNRIINEALSDDHPLKIMYKSGARGAEENTAQIMGIVGQQWYSGERIRPTLSNGRRILPYYHDRVSPESGGFVTSSYFHGLDPGEIFFTAANGREGVTNTANATPTVGSLTHTVIKMLENLMVYYDHSVRRSDGSIIQFYFGDDGFSAAKLRKVSKGDRNTFSFINLNSIAEEINHKYSQKAIIRPSKELTYAIVSDKIGIPVDELKVLLNNSGWQENPNPDERQNVTFVGEFDVSEHTKLMTIPSVVKNVLYPKSDGSEMITNRWNLYANMLDKFPDVAQKYMKQTFPLKDMKYTDGDVVIIRSVNHSTDDVIVSSKIQFDAIRSHDLQSQLEIVKVCSQYIRNPILFDGLRFNIRMYAYIHSGVNSKYVCRMLDKGEILTASSPYVDGNYSNKDIHEVSWRHTKQTYIFPDDVVGHLNNVAAKPENIQLVYLQMRTIIDYVGRFFEPYAKPYAGSLTSFEIFAVDFVVDANMNVYLIDLSTLTHRPVDDNLKNTPKIVNYIQSYYRFIYENALKPLETAV